MFQNHYDLFVFLIWNRQLNSSNNRRLIPTIVLCLFSLFSRGDNWFLKTFCLQQECQFGDSFITVDFLLFSQADELDCDFRRADKRANVINSLFAIFDCYTTFHWRCQWFILLKCVRDNMYAPLFRFNPSWRFIGGWGKRGRFKQKVFEDHGSVYSEKDIMLSFGSLFRVALKIAWQVVAQAQTTAVNFFTGRQTQI